MLAGERNNKIETENEGVLPVWTICGDPSDASIVNYKKSSKLYFMWPNIHSIILLIIRLHINKIQGQVSVQISQSFLWKKRSPLCAKALF